MQEWVFSGIGTEMLGWAIGGLGALLVGGGAVWWKVLRPNADGNAKQYNLGESNQMVAVDSQHQNVGNYSPSLQTAGPVSGNINQIINIGIDENQTRAMVEKCVDQKFEVLAESTNAMVQERLQNFSHAMDSRISRFEENREQVQKNFCDPSTQVFYGNAQRVAVCTNRPIDFDLLSELVVQRIQQPNDNRLLNTSLSRAVEIVNQIDHGALCGLTLIYFFRYFSPNLSNCHLGLDQFAKTFEKLIETDLPTGLDWLDHLQVLGAVTLNPVMAFNLTEDTIAEKMNGYSSAGIRIGSEAYLKAQELLKANGLPFSFIVQNELMEGYVKLPIAHRNDVEKLNLNVRTGDKSFNISLTKEQRKALENVWDLYDRDAEVKKRARDAFIAEWNKREPLKKALDWWKTISRDFLITSVGRALAQSNAQRCDSAIPDLPEYQKNRK